MKGPLGSTNMTSASRRVGSASVDTSLGAHPDSAEIVRQWRTLLESVARTAIDAGRSPSDVSVVCVSKTQPAAVIECLLQQGERAFGENRVQEANAKWPALHERYQDVKLHLIGPLQSNKVREALELFDVIETLDRPSLLSALAKGMSTVKTSPRLLVQVNTGAEPQKSGVLPESADAFIKSCRSEFELPIGGLMCIPPFGEPAAPHFALLAQIAARNGLSDLSMGMTADYQCAIQLGATHVRIGTAIFGKRPLDGHT